MMIDLEYAKKKFELYLKDYDMKDEKILLKKKHTFAVLDTADYICKKEKMSQEDTQLALLIALLHDIGRFEQLKTFQSFDDRKFDHAEFGVKVLFDEGKIRDFLEDRKYDEIIKKAIAYHSAYKLPRELSKKEELQCKIIRDADKLDNFRVKETEKIETLFDTPAEEVGKEEISDHVLNDIREERTILSNTRKTNMDKWVSYLAFVFDLNFRASFQFLEENQWIDRNIRRIKYTNKETKKRMEEIQTLCNTYVKNHLREKMVFFDIDGTIIDNDTHQIPESTKKAIKKMREKGHIAVVNTGRTWVSIDKELKEMGFDGYICGCGTYLWYQGEWLLKKSLPKKLCLETVQNFRAWKVPAFYEGYDGVYFDVHAGFTDQRVEKIKKEMGKRAKELPEIVTEESINFDKFCLYFLKESKKEEALSWLEKNFFCIQREHEMMEIVPKGYSKATGMEYLRKKLDIPLENCYAIGDSTNDLTMLCAVPNSIAMGGAPQEVVSVCRYQTKSVMEDGIAWILKRCGCI